jgi:hypothetical protein
MLDNGLMLLPGGLYEKGLIAMQNMRVPIFVPPDDMYGYNDDIQTDILQDVCFPAQASSTDWAQQPGAFSCQCKIVSDDGWRIVAVKDGHTNIPVFSGGDQLLMRMGKALSPQGFPYGPMKIASYQNEQGQIAWSLDWPEDSPTTIEADDPVAIYYEPWSAIETTYNDIRFGPRGEHVQGTIRWNVGNPYDTDGTSGATLGNRLTSIASFGPMLQRAVEMQNPNDRVYTLVVQQKGDRFRALIRTVFGWIEPQGARSYSFWLSYVDGTVKEKPIVREPKDHPTIGPLFQFP